MIDTTKIPTTIYKGDEERTWQRWPGEPVLEGYSLTPPPQPDPTTGKIPTPIYSWETGEEREWQRWPGEPVLGGYSLTPIPTTGKTPTPIYKGGEKKIWQRWPDEPILEGYSFTPSAGYTPSETETPPWEDFMGRWDEFLKKQQEQQQVSWEQTQGALPGGEEFPYPPQWETATDVMTGLAQTGMPGVPPGFQAPPEWGAATETYGELAKTGMPGITPEYAEKAWLPYQRKGQQKSIQAREEAGLSGMRWGTPLAGQIEDIWGGASERFGAEMEQMRMQDIAAQRQARLAGSAGLAGIGGQRAGYGLQAEQMGLQDLASQRQARLAATGQLAGLGGQYAGLPLDISQQMMGMGATLQGLQQQEIAPLLQEFLRTQPEYSPLLQMMFGGATGLPTGPNMYGPSAGGNIMSWLPLLLGLI